MAKESTERVAAVQTMFCYKTLNVHNYSLSILSSRQSAKLQRILSNRIFYNQFTLPKNKLHFLADYIK